MVFGSCLILSFWGLLSFPSCVLPLFCRFLSTLLRQTKSNKESLLCERGYDSNHNGYCEDRSVFTKYFAIIMCLVSVVYKNFCNHTVYLHLVNVHLHEALVQEHIHSHKVVLQLYV